MPNKHIFSPEALARVMRETLPTDAQPGEKVVVGEVNQDGVRVVASFKRNVNTAFGWELQAAAVHDWDGDTQAGGKVILRWK